MPFSDLDPLPEAPQRTDEPEDFIVKADAFVAAMTTFSEQLNTFISELETAAALIAAAPSYAAPSLVAIAPLTPAADKLPYYTSSSAAALATFTTLARSLLASSSTSAMRTVLELGALATLGNINGSNWSGQDLAVADGGTGASSASAARTNLGVYSQGEVDAAVTAAMPSGAVQAFARNSAPTGWLKCNGSAVSRSTYSALFSAIGTTFGAGDGSTTFNLPDLRGEFVRGWADDGSVDSGRAFGSLQADELKSHSHNVQAGFGGSALESGGGGTASTFSTGSTGGAETRPVNVALLYCIKI